jgi:hypothetical protein
MTETTPRPAAACMHSLPHVHLRITPRHPYSPHMTEDNKIHRWRWNSGPLQSTPTPRRRSSDRLISRARYREGGKCEKGTCTSSNSNGERRRNPRPHTLSHVTLLTVPSIPSSSHSPHRCLLSLPLVSHRLPTDAAAHTDTIGEVAAAHPRSAHGALIHRGHSHHPTYSRSV